MLRAQESLRFEKSLELAARNLRRSAESSVPHSTSASSASTVASITMPRKLAGCRVPTVSSTSPGKREGRTGKKSVTFAEKVATSTGRKSETTSGRTMRVSQQIQHNRPETTTQSPTREGHFEASQVNGPLSRVSDCECRKIVLPFYGC
ncbi:unnamed protein product [Protopolystoma xenopodis]|uniref:Uncharacterized protein n=1 Tax=Protopolystoma xenopodis TaxID=117903 RepID=A0A3S5ADT7_9PLAT|nr:unnamed protein product [Protopolystoma xenopodis]